MRRRAGWKKSTTYTVIKRLTERGVVHTENAVVTALVGRQDVQNAESRAFVDKNFTEPAGCFCRRLSETSS